MGLLELPTELRILIADDLGRLGYGNLNSLCRVNRRLHNILNRYLYQQNIQEDDSDVMPWAAIHGSMATLKKALQYGADVNTTAWPNCPPFPDGFELRVSDLLWSPLGTDRTVATTKNNPPRDFALAEEPATPLMHAAGAGYTELVETLLQHGARVNAASKSGFTPLMAAACGGHTRVMEILLAAGADTTAKRHGETPALDMAAEKGHVDAVRLLLRVDEDQSRITWDEALVGAAQGGRIQVLREFLDAGADPRANYDSDGHGMPLIFWATEGDDPDIVSLLLDLGEDIERLNDATETPLIYSAYSGSLEVCEMLLRRGADVNALDERGRSSLYLAKEGGETEIEEMLMKYGADDIEPDEYLASVWEGPDSEMY
ncbi:hypothetical protein CNMCM6106_007563 [Aspergillus hiratsukae]|uniref:Ankyrin repeat-containing domain protein n=1 Tax=Aspergillus hiratsukae TaxID=1194566 RepID=A0A8H6V0X0_9EURO|nr:hypothetical protein CNMCM6106_007563 [Aspergillus hiratsukae]